MGDAERQPGPAKGTARRGVGRIRQERSGKFSAAYIGPDNVLHRAPNTFEAKVYAEGWLAGERRLIELGAWQPPQRRAQARFQTVQQTAQRRTGLSGQRSPRSPQIVATYPLNAVDIEAARVAHWCAARPWARCPQPMSATIDVADITQPAESAGADLFPPQALHVTLGDGGQGSSE